MKQLFRGRKPSIYSMALSLVALTACMPAKQDEQWLKDKDLVIQSLQDAHAINAKLTEKVDMLDQKVLTLENTIAKHESKIAAMEAGLAQSKNLAPEPKKKTTGSKSKKDLNKRLDDLSKKLNPVVPAASAALEEKNAYTAAYLALKSGRYGESSNGFKEVIKNYPSGDYTDQAYYWLGESQLAQHMIKDAVSSFTSVADHYPKSPKRAAALLKLASSYAQLNRNKESKSALQKLIKEHPDSKEAEQARAELAKPSE